MRLVVDGARCQGHNRCAALAPDLVDIDDFGNAHPAGDGLLSCEQVETARRAAAECPEQAISLLDAETP